MKSKTLKELEPFITEKMGSDEAKKAMELSCKRFEELLKENDSESKALRLLQIRRYTLR